MSDRVRRIAAAIVLAAGLALAAWRLNGHYPIKTWLVWPYLHIWCWCAVWSLACLSAGHALLRRLRGWSIPLREHVAFAFAGGVLVFVLGVFVLGLFHALGAVTFVAWPVVMIAVGARPLWRDGRRVRRLVAQVRSLAAPRSRGATAGTFALFLLGGLAVFALYLNILTPSNVAYDAHWYHLGVAEHYAADGAIRRFPEGWFPGALPQLASLIYTWAFLVPGGGLFTRIELAAHLEMVVFLATLASLPLLVRWLLRGAWVPMSWTALFLFPGIFIYDSTLSGAADHVLAFWGVPVFLALGRFWRSGSRRDAGLLATMLAGAALTKYQSLYMLVPICTALVVRAVVLAWRARALRPVLAPAAVFAGVLALLTSIHWLKNLIWYGDPVYPMLHSTLNHLRPWNPDADPSFHHASDFKVEGTFGHRVFESLKAVATFAFEPHDWPAAHGEWPVFGFLFTLLVPLALLLDKAWRLRAIGAASLAGVFLWFWTYHEDRYLQSLVPWMAAFVAAVLWRLWRSGRIVRGLTILLVALQVVWGGDHYFIPTHAMLWQQPLRVVLDLLGGGYTKRGADRYGFEMSNLHAAGKTLPKKARVLIHEQHRRLGIATPAVSDSRGTQGGISYGRQGSPRELWERLRSMGVTHMLWLSAPMWIETWADEAVFYDFVTKYLDGTHSAGGASVGALRPTPPPDRRYGAVAILGCQVSRRVSLLEVQAAIFMPTPVPSRAEIVELERGVDFILIESACRSRLPSVGGYDQVTNRNGWETWSRR